MLTSPSRADDTDDFLGPAKLNVYLEVERFLSAVRRQIWLIVAVVLLSTIAGICFLVTRTPLYTASALVLIDNRHVRSVDNAYETTTTLPDMASSLVDSQVEVVRSAQVAEKVIKKLGLLDNPLYTQPSYSKLDWLKYAIFGKPAGESDNGGSSAKNIEMRRAIERLQFNLEVHRVGRTMVLQISYTAASPMSAADTANAYAEAYLADQLDSKFEATKRASQWLEQRLADLKEKALSADLAVQKFRADHGLIVSGGKLVNEQQLSELNTQLVTARGERARAEARYHRIAQIIKLHETTAIVSEAIGNRLIEQLRAKYLDVSKRKAELEAKVGTKHQTVVALKAEMTEYEQEMFAELTRLSEAYRSEVDIDRAKEVSLSENLQKLVAVAASENKSLVTLRELEREGDAYRNLYQSYMQRYQESLQQQSFPIIDARIITSAYQPLKPSWPKKLATLIIFGFLGGAVGALLGAFREFREKGFIREEQIRSELGVECLGVVPLVRKPGSMPRPVAGGHGKKGDAKTPSRVLDLPPTWIAGENLRKITQSREVTKVLEVSASSPSGQDSKHAEGGAKFEASSAIMSYAIDNPGSAFVETLMAVKLAADIKLSGVSSKVIGVVSALPSEGKSVISKNFASVLAKLNGKTLLIDADLRGPELTRQLTPRASQGLIEAVIGTQQIDKTLYREESSGLRFLPAVSNTRVPHTSELLASEGMRRLLSQAQQDFDYIIIDLPPFGPVVDVRAIAPQIQAFVYVLEWRNTSRRIVRDLLDSDDYIKRKCLGVVLNKVNVSQIKLFEDHGSRYYYFKRYKKSYYLEGN